MAHTPSDSHPNYTDKIEIAYAAYEAFQSGDMHDFFVRLGNTDLSLVSSPTALIVDTENL